MIPGVRVDGNDVIAVFEVAREAVKRAREGSGPTLIECRTYRWKEHVGPYSDIELGYRPQEELDWWMERCPIKRFKEFLLDKEIISEQEIEEIAEELEREIEEAVIFGQNSPFPDESELEEGVYRDVR
jgi:pyruvate dehydrogenase E1 component alpha subunit